jgi:uncharacterized protein YodC (DUF2158 family)
MDPFQPGDVVTLKSGSPKMTVLSSDENSTNCWYYDTATNKMQPDQNIPSVLLQGYGMPDKKKLDPVKVPAKVPIKVPKPKSMPK